MFERAASSLPPSLDPAHLTVSWLDITIVGVVAVAVLGGLRRGRMSDAASSVGHLAGALAGFLLAGWAAPRVSSPVPAWILLAALTLAGASAGGALGRAVTGRSWARPGGLSSLVAGALAGLVALGACWAAVQVVADLGPDAAAQARSRSAVVTSLDRADPAASAALGAELRHTDAPTFRNVQLRELTRP